MISTNATKKIQQFVKDIGFHQVKPTTIIYDN